MKTLILISMLALAGCASNFMWTHPDPTVTQQQFERDKYECTNEGYRHAADLGFGGNPFISSDWAAQCMKARGYVQQKVEKQT